MSCFIVPLVQAVATTAYRRHNAQTLSEGNFLKRQIPALEKMLWGGTLMLVVDHVVNGELTWRFPFFTALDQAGGGLVMLKEMLTVGVPMSLVLTFAWAAWAFWKERRNVNTKTI